ncbi:MAG: precorrin-6A reductase [Dehalobacter sp. 4CP]|uniref:precorrin-6A reductase n=1 Tax=Dehalobacter sp. CP TaxID=2594474 RepID=UPI0013C875CC|nr:precorrin-6A reductase [Dehalobacter sp. 4CP]
MMKMPVFWIIAGTTEGRELIDELRRSNAKVYVSVATDYGRELIEPDQNLHIQARRLGREEMAAFIREVQPDCVIDTTHPYAQIVTDNICEACRETATDYIRLQREPGRLVSNNPSFNTNILENMIYADNSEDAVRVLNDKTGNVFLSCGSKEIETFTRIKDYQERVFARVLPMQDVMDKCEKLGFKKSNISYMQGPFSKELNIAMLKASQARFLVTKDSGETGGFQEKIEAARELGITVILIRRPEQLEILERSGKIDEKEDAQQHTFYNKEQVLHKLAWDYSLKQRPNQPWFPLFVSLQNKKIVVFGGGKIAARRIRTLLPFDADITVITPELVPELKQELAGNEKVTLLCRKYQEGDCNGADLVLAVTNETQVNRQIAEECTRYGIPVSVADCKELCTFYFPAVVRKGNVVIGLTASGEDHTKAKKTAEKLRLYVNEHLDE